MTLRVWHPKRVVVASFALTNVQDAGWPYEGVDRVDEIVLIDCPHLVVPANLQVRDMIAIQDGPRRIEFIMETPLLVLMYNVKVPHILADVRIGEPLKNLVEVPQMALHPFMDMTIDTLEIEEDMVVVALS